MEPRSEVRSRACRVVGAVPPSTTTSVQVTVPARGETAKARRFGGPRARVNNVQSIPGEEAAVPLEGYIERVRAHESTPEAAFAALVLAVTASTSGT